MRFLHISDLHLGKRFNELSMLDDQRHILRQLTAAVDRERPDAVLIAGDVYDKPVPPAEAVALWDGFLAGLAARRLPVFVICGNHDSPERVTQYAGLTGGAGIHIAPPLDGTFAPHTLADASGPVDVWLLPFLRPADARRFWPDEPADTWTDALRTAVSHMAVDPSRRSVLVAHQYVTGAKRSESDVEPIGGLDNVDVSVFDPFAYVALGHIHAPQSVTRDGRVRYCGAQLKYDFAEAWQTKSATVADLAADGSVALREIPLEPLHEVRNLRGTFGELLEGARTEDYIGLTLTDEDDVPDAMDRLRTVYPNALALRYDNARTRAASDPGAADLSRERDPADLAAEFFREMNGRPLTDEEAAWLHAAVRDVWEEEEEA